MKSLWGQSQRYLRIRRDSVDVSPGLARTLLIALCILIGVVFIAGDVGLWNLWRAQKQLSSLTAKISELERRNEALQAEIELLKNDTYMIEKVAREKYGYLREGDRVYRIVTVPEKSGSKASSIDSRQGNP